MLFHRRFEHRYPRIVRGSGAWLYDDEGNTFLDAVGGAGVAILGHGLEELARQAAESMRHVSYLHGTQFTTPELEAYGERLVALAPDNISHVLLMGSGSDAVETALKLAYQFHLGKSGTGRKREVIATEPGYHGATGLALAVTGKARDRLLFSGLLREQHFIPAPDVYRRPEQSGEACADALERKILEVGPENCLAFIVEPVIGASMGVSVPPTGYLQRVRDICDRYDVTLIFDEVMCGFGRCGTWFASEASGVQADIIVQGKGMAAGLLPLSAVYASRAIVEQLHRDGVNFAHGFTFTNHPFSAAVGARVLDVIERDDLLENVQRQGHELRGRLRELTAFPWVDDVRGLGLFCGFELVADKHTRRAFPRTARLAEQVLQRAMRRGGNFYFSIGYLPDGSGDSILVMPPYNVTTPELNAMVTVLRDTLAELDPDVRALARQSA
ncbi:aminotransferase class III-fold pyridoxal phosphate-dependent enzyme [Comamonas sp. JC664]|uniref:aminotransferase family protein n=1 Tax=Comamonas sp. JC664 TaxID=2801917 RepID=UPI00174EB1DF|nr:aminotransferase class III-fold pyridoxal phosphate-dependent enzyme [Comamonas sp. JC664]MBL0695547.1 aspartate aminotransferase family protein [Comamonas sp. JC664]GHG62166.1 aspartate aminotransferase family protein [Comamonas sp. KCTC 72670]